MNQTLFKTKVHIFIHPATNGDPIVVKTELGIGRGLSFAKNRGKKVERKL